MSTTSKPIDYSHLSVEERILLAQEIWDSIVDEGAVIEPTEAQKAELDRRMQRHRDNPEEGSSWEEVEERLRNRLAE